MATTTLDNLISESGRRTGIGAAAEPLTRELLQMMTGGPGGLTAFIERFRSAGLGAEVASFLGGRSDAPLPSKAVDRVIGETTLAGMAQRAGVAPAAAANALGFEIPRLIAMLTPGGAVTGVLPTEIRSFVSRQEQVSPTAMATLREEEQVRPAAMATLREDEQVRPAAMATLRDAKPRSFTWLWALLALAILAGVLWTLLGNRTSAPVATAPVVSAPAVTAPAVSVPAPVAPAVTDTVTTLNQALNGTVLNFPTASSALPAASAAQLREAATRIKGLPAGTVIEVSGHTDNVGDQAANMALSQRRAEAVRSALVKDGVEASMLTAKGYGPTKPVASNDTPEGRAQNRRTEFAVASTVTSTTTTTTRPAGQ
jgi:outer membrane protein OmpA-like peptidoglycan-associated protein/uncharacterized protein YidB (DUF937 family)